MKRFESRSYAISIRNFHSQFTSTIYNQCNVVKYGNVVCKYGNDTEESFRHLEEKHQEYKTKLIRKRDKKWKTLEKNRDISISTNIEVQSKKAKVRNNLDKEKLLTDKN